MVNLLGDYSDRIKKLRPSFVTTEPNNTEFEIIYKECMNAWLFGLNNAAIILCCSLIENLLKEKLKEVPKWEIYHTSNGLGSQNRKLKSLDSLIKDAKKHNILDNQTKNKAFGIKNIRNHAIHDLQTISSNTTLNMIYDTKEIINKILS